MMTGGVQWDAQLGGTEALPQSIHLLGHAAARSAELSQMHVHLAASASNYRSGHSSKLAFQRIPHHMRRRAMSHNVRRLPRRLRDIHAAQMRKSRNGRTDTELQRQMRRPSRKYRRRPANLITEYTRRRTNVHWLHTHIWHAKRCQMELRWGWRLPVRPTARSYRANYRAAARHCFIQDISFVCCIQLEGRQDDIVNGLVQIIDSSDICVGTTNLTAKRVITGNREGTVHARDITTKQPIGLLTYQWRPFNTNDDGRAIWLWVHASFYTQMMSNLHTVFLNQTDRDNNDCVAIENKSAPQISQLRHDLARFRVRGPLATSVLQRVLRSDREQDGWWEQLRTTTAQCVSPRSVYELMVHDTRLHYPQKKTKATVRITAEADTTAEAILPVVKVEKTDTNQTSFLWDASVRHQLNINRESTASLVNRRTQLLVPGTTPSPQTQPIPMILIQHPGSVRRGFASGWDLILPMSHAQATWLALVLWGGHVGGLLDAEHCRLEVADVQTSDVLHPDTVAGRMESDRRSGVWERKYWARPPNRRCNYRKLGVVSPFRAKWEILIKDWLETDVENFDVLRQRRSIEIISNALRGINEAEMNKKRSPGSLKLQICHRKQQSQTTTFVEQEPNNFQLLKDLNCAQPTLIHVRLTLLGRGRCSPNALICLPQPKDLKINSDGIEEPLHSDIRSEQARRKLRSQHLAGLRMEKRKRKAAKRSEHIESNTKKMLEEYRDTMRALWIPTSINNVRNSCAREVIGWVTEAAFSFVCGRWVALGYVVLPALPRILHTSQLSVQQVARVLLRDTRSRCYKFVSFELL